MKASPIENIKILRHLEEQTTDLGIERDGEVISTEVRLINESFAPQIADMYVREGKSVIRIVTSDTKRAKTTASLLGSELDKKYGLESQVIVDPRTEALRHGRYKLGVTQDHPLVKRAQQIYVSETFYQNNPWYRHGSEVRDINNCAYQELGEIFECPGENQVELSIRFYGFLQELLEDTQKEELVVLSSHYVILSRLLSLEHMTKGIDRTFAAYHQANGKLYEQEWHAGLELMKNIKFHDFFKQHNYIFDLDLNQIRMLQPTITTDLEILKAQYTQHYGKEPGKY